MDKLTKENIVGTTLFGEGAAVCVLRTGDGSLARVEMSGQHTWPDTLGIMGWSVDDPGMGVIFDRAIPPFAEANIACDFWHTVARGAGLGDIDRFACHPG
jgi:alkylresorcinol/alkylpyrone synthase